ncbi:MAG: plasmid pRiA4b ORF-3 family protein [Rhodococcus sp. (in: high G+C Gram-positive bacteria)]
MSANRKKARKPAEVIPLFGVETTSLGAGFSDWLVESGFPGDVAPVAELLDSILEMLGGLRPDFRPTAWRPRDAHFWLEALDSLADEPEMADAMASMSLAFLQYLDGTGRWTGSASDLGDCVETLSNYLGESVGPVVTPGDIVVTAGSPVNEFEALSSLKPVAQLRSLLSWLGKGKQITGTGVVRPALIAALAAAVGIELSDGEQSARSMREIPSLMALWEAATAAGLIELTSTKAFAGPRAHEFAQSQLTSLPATHVAIVQFVRRYFEVDDALDRFQAVKVFAAQIVLAAMTEDPPAVIAPADPSESADTFDAVAESMLRRLVGHFVTDGWLVADGTYRVPDPLRPVILDALRSLDFFDAEELIPGSSERPQRLNVTVRLLHTDPNVWRKLKLDDDLTLDMMHEVIQLAFGWENTHLHHFRSGSRRSMVTYVPSELVTEFGEDSRAEHAVTIGTLLLRRGDTVTYEYDFGDSWEHLITLDSIDDHDPKFAGARCMDGANMTPFEDSGGPIGWAHHLAAAADPRHEGHHGSREWLGLRKGQSIDPTDFDLKAAQSAVNSMFMQRP